MIRYIRAFFLALIMTLRGEKPVALSSYPELHAWIETTTGAVHEVFKVAENQGFSQKDRKSFIIRVEGRNTSMETILATVRYHVTQEYPHLLKHANQHSITAIYASNMNDQFQVSMLLEHIENIEVKVSLNKLKSNLELIPNTT